MAELDEVLEGEDINKSEKRYKDLSEKVRTTAEERDKIAQEKADAEAAKAAAEKERDFYASFADTTSQYPQAKDHKDEIKQKVMAGYTVEDATVSVLAKVGKFIPPKQERETPAGGSATNPPPQPNKKDAKDMSRDELRAALVEAEARGDITT